MVSSGRPGSMIFTGRWSLSPSEAPSLPHSSLSSSKCYAEAKVCWVFDRGCSCEGVEGYNGGKGVGKSVVVTNPMAREGDGESVSVYEFKRDGVGKESRFSDLKRMGVLGEDMKWIGQGKPVHVEQLRQSRWGRRGRRR